MSVDERTQGFLKGLEDATIDPSECSIVNADWTFERGYEATSVLLAMRPQIEAIFAHNDPLAVGAIRAVVESGRRVPDDVAVIGYDDVPLASYVTPTLTTVQNRVWETGTIAARVLVDILEGKTAVDAISNVDLSSLEPRLVIRESCP